MVQDILQVSELSTLIQDFWIFDAYLYGMVLIWRIGNYKNIESPSVNLLWDINLNRMLLSVLYSYYVADMKICWMV